MKKSYGERLVKGSVYSIASIVLVYVLQIFRGGMIARLLGTDFRGMLAIVESINVIVIPVVLIGIHIGIAKLAAEYLARKDKRIDNLLSTCFTLLVITSIAGSVIYFLSAGIIATGIYQTPSLAILLEISAVVLSIGVFASLGAGILQGFQKIRTLAVINVVNIAISIPIIYFLGVNYGLIGVVAALAVSSTVNMAIIIAILLSFLKTYNLRLKLHIDRGILKEMTRYSTPLMLSLLVLPPAYLFGYSYMYLVIGPGQVGLFRVADSLFKTMMFIPAGIVVPLLPLVSELEATDSERRRALTSLTARVVMLGLLPICAFVTLFAESIIWLIFGVEFVGAHMVMSILATIAIFAGTYALLAQVLVGIGRSSQVFLLDLSYAITHVILSYFLINWFGLLGLAYVALILQPLFFFILISYLWKRAEIKIKSIALPMTLISLFFPAFLLVRLFSFPYQLSIFAVLFLVFLGIEYMLLTSDDKQMLTRIIKKIVA